MQFFRIFIEEKEDPRWYCEHCEADGKIPTTETRCLDMSRDPCGSLECYSCGMSYNHNEMCYENNDGECFED